MTEHLTSGRGLQLRMEPVAVRAALEAVVGPQGDPGRLTCFFVAQRDTTTWRARALALDISGWEDPATGSAAGPFGAWLARLGGPSRITILQGVEMGDPSRIDVDVSDGIVIGGQVLVRAMGTIDLARFSSLRTLLPLKARPELTSSRLAHWAAPPR